MHIFLGGPAGPEQVATKWLLEQRGYHQVVCESDILQKDYAYNRGMRPSPRDFRRFRTLELAQARVCVVEDGIPAAELQELMAAARYAGIPVLRYDQLPAQAPSMMREDGVLEALLADNQAPPPPRWIERLNLAFNARFAWFFTNGMKTSHA